MSDGKYYHMTENVSLFLKTATEEETDHVIENLEHYISEYQRIRSDAGDLAAAWNFHNLIDAMLTTEDADEVISCKKGCSFCCQIHVDITEDEGALLVKTAEEKGVKIDRALIKRQAEFGPENWTLQPYEDWACAFLNTKEGTCNVYEHRPAACRNHGVVSDPALCDPKENPKALTTRLARLMPNLIASAVMNACESKSMAKTILEKLK